MWKNIAIMQLIVVLVAVIGGSDSSCASLSCSSNCNSITDGDDVDKTTPFVKMGGMLAETADRIVPDTITRMFTQLTKKQLLMISLVGATIVLTSSFAVHRANNSPARYDIEKEAKKISSALGSSSARTQERLKEITAALCTKLSGVSDAPPVDIFTLAAITENSSTENRTTQIDTTVAKTTAMRTTEAVTTAPLQTEDPEITCPSPAEKVVDSITNVIEKLRNGFMLLDLFSDNDIELIQGQLHETAGANCKPEFLREDEIGGHQGIWLNTTNKYVNTAVNNNACKRAADKILPVLYGLGHDSKTICTDRACTLNFETNEMKASFLEGENIARRKSCGDGFFEVTGEDEKSIQYQSSNTYIGEAWPPAINDQKCQERADRVIAMLNSGGHVRSIRFLTKTAYNTTYDLTALKTAYELGDGSDCGEGALNMEEIDGDLVFTYDCTNPFAVKAWERAPEIVTCMRKGKNIFDYLLKFGLFSKDDDASIIIPKRNKNIQILMREVDATKKYDCKEGFFKYEENDGYFRVLYKKNNPYIKPEWEKVTDEQLCNIVAKGVHCILEAYKLNIETGQNEFSFKLNRSVRTELKTKLQLINDVNCGEGFFTPAYETNSVVISFNTNNPNIDYD